MPCGEYHYPRRSRKRERAATAPGKESTVIGQEASPNGLRADPREVDVASVTLSVPAGPTSVTQVRDALGRLVAEGDPVVLEQVAVLVGALTSGADRPDAPPSAPFELELRAETSRVVVEIYDSDFTAHRSEGGLVELERSMVSAWRLKLVERLADRWSITHDDVFTLRFEFDVEQSMTLHAGVPGP